MSKVSIIIPCRNEVNYIEKLIDSIEKSDYESDCLEIIIVDGLSTDGTRELIKTKYIQSKSNVKIIDNVRQKTPYAFNIGIKEASGEYILIIGARHVISENYISGAVAILNSDLSVGCVGGRVIHAYENKTSELISLSMSTKFGMGVSNFRSRSSDGFVDTIGTPCFRRKIFEEVGFFDENLTRNQDDDFSFRIIQKGYKIFLNSNINVKYFVRGSFSRVFRQFSQYGYWKVYVNRKHRKLTTYRQLFPAFFIISVLLLTLLTLLDYRIFFLLLFELSVYLLLGVATAIRLLNSSSLGFIDGLRIVFSFLVLHIGYGTGYLTGILHFYLMDKRPSEKFEVLSR